MQARMDRHLTTKEKIIGLGGLALLSMTITFVDWWQRGQLDPGSAILAGLSAVVFLFWIPVSSGYYGITKFGQQRVVREFPIWYACFYVGFFLWGTAIGMLYESMQFGWGDLLFMAVPWSVGTYVIYRSYCSYKALQAERLLRKQAELNQLRQTLQPHFLFNSLNTLSAFVSSAPDKAESLIQDLAAVLRHILETDKAQTISLKRELLILQKWLNIEQARLGSDLKVTFNVPDDTLAYQIPPFVLQPVLENAIKHSVALPIAIDLNCRKRGNKLHIQVRDNGPGFPQSVLQHNFADGVGLATTVQRIGRTPGANISLANGSEPSGAIVTLEFEANLG